MSVFSETRTFLARVLGIKREETFHQDASLGILPSGPGGKNEDHRNHDGS